MKVQGKVGIIQASNGTETDLRTTRNGALVTAPGEAEYAEIVLSGNVFIGANPAATPVTTQAGLSATTPVLTLYNPVGSPVNLILIDVSYCVVAAPAAATSIMLAYNLANATAPATTTDASITSGIVGTASKPSGECYRIATLGTAPVAFRYLGGVTAASVVSTYSSVHDIKGKIVVAPGVAISIQATTAVSLLASMSWEEESI